MVQSTHKAAQPATAKRSVVRFPTAKARFPPRGSDFVRRDSHTTWEYFLQFCSGIIEREKHNRETGPTVTAFALSHFTHHPSHRNVFPTEPSPTWLSPCSPGSTTEPSPTELSPSSHPDENNCENRSNDDCLRSPACYSLPLDFTLPILTIPVIELSPPLNRLPHNCLHALPARRIMLNSLNCLHALAPIQVQR